MALAARHTQAQGPSPSIGQDMDLGTEAAPAAAEGGLRLLLFGRARRAHVRARPYCPAAWWTDPDRPAGRPVGAARRPSCTTPHNGNRPSSTSRMRPATGTKARPSVPSSAALPRRDGNALHRLRVYRNRPRDRRLGANCWLRGGPSPSRNCFLPSWAPCAPVPASPCRLQIRKTFAARRTTPWRKRESLPVSAHHISWMSTTCSARTAPLHRRPHPLQAPAGQGRVRAETD